MEQRQLTLRWQMGAYALRKFLVPSEAAQVIPCELQHVYDLIEEGRLLAQAPVDREKRRYQIDVRSIEACIAQRMLYTDEEFFRAVTEVLERLQRPEIERALLFLRQRLSRVS